MKKLQRTAVLIVLLTAVFAVNAHAGIFDDIGGAMDKTVKGLTANVGGLVGLVLINVKNAAMTLVDKLYEQIRTLLIKVWDITRAAGKDGVNVGVGDVSGKVSGIVAPVFFALAGVLIYFFFMQGVLVFMSKGENIVNVVFGAAGAVLLLIAYPLIYSFVIEVAYRAADMLLKMNEGLGKNIYGMETLINNLTSTITGNAELVSRYASNSTLKSSALFDSIKNDLFNPAFWLMIITQLIIIIISAIFIIEVLFLKGQQIISVILSYFLGFIAISLVSTPSFAESFKKWIQSFVAVSLYGFYWMMILLILNLVSMIHFQGLDKGAEAAILLFATFGAFHLMTKVGTIAETLAVGREISGNAGREFSQRMRSAAQTTGMIAAGAGAVAGGALIANATAGGFMGAGISSLIHPGAKMPKLGTSNGSAMGKSGRNNNGFLSQLGGAVTSGANTYNTMNQRLLNAQEAVGRVLKQGFASGKDNNTPSVNTSNTGSDAGVNRWSA
jgi:hypothetical protein